MTCRHDGNHSAQHVYLNSRWRDFTEVFSVFTANCCEHTISCGVMWATRKLMPLSPENLATVPLPTNLVYSFFLSRCITWWKRQLSFGLALLKEENDEWITMGFKFFALFLFLIFLLQCRLLYDKLRGNHLTPLWVVSGEMILFCLSELVNNKMHMDCFDKCR